VFSYINNSVKLSKKFGSFIYFVYLCGAKTKRLPSLTKKWTLHIEYKKTDKNRQIFLKNK